MTSDTYHKLNKTKPSVRHVRLLLGVGAAVAIWCLVRHYNPDSRQLNSADTKSYEEDLDLLLGRLQLEEDSDDEEEDGETAEEAKEQKTSFCNLYNLWSANKDDYECSTADVPPHPLICFYPQGHSHESVNSDWDRGGLEKISELLRQGNGSLGLIDIGAKIGIYTLTVAAMKRQVLAVEPDIHNVRRLHKAVKLARLESKVTLLHNAVSDSRDLLSLADGEEVKQIVLGDLPPFCRFYRAVMRLDLQGYERRAFSQAKALFSQIQITHVFVEWDLFRSLADVEMEFIDDMVEYMNRKGYVPRSLQGKVLAAGNWRMWPNGIYWQKM